jgi:type III secretory pathway component EscS
MLQVLAFTLVNAIIIGVFIWILQELISLIPLSPTFAKLVRIIVVLITLILAYDLVVLPLAHVFDLNLPKIH